MSFQPNAGNIKFLSAEVTLLQKFNLFFPTWEGWKSIFHRVHLDCYKVLVRRNEDSQVRLEDNYLSFT